MWILISGLDDLFITLVGFATSRIRFPWPSAGALNRVSERPIAIFVPLWREHSVIGRMLEHNLAAIRYANYQVFVGVYPNDTRTIQAVERQARLHPRIQMAVCPHDGPTSKGDCLNWIYRRMKEYEMRHDMRFRIVMMHDAEDLIDPESLRLVNWFSRRYAMVQVPVLPLPTRVAEWTHGLYCDEFAEYQRKDIPVRQHLGGFLPSNGVGTGFARDALDHLAAERGGSPFDPACLTEDYETGFLLHALGYLQIFLPVRIGAAGPMATREFFPRRPSAAISQRTRWVTGIVLQSWERHGWRAPLPQLYWFWRDRKGLVGNLLSPAANLLFIYGAGSYACNLGHPGPWHFGTHIPAWIVGGCRLTFAIALLQAGVRARSVSLLYGWRFAACVPIRMVWGNFVNFAATAIALWEFGRARHKGLALTWRKTEHTYPAAASIPTAQYQSSSSGD
ncbi:MAG: bacteriophage receptor, outer membrane protein [Candidatus Solibacter sp.]|nr:bacteriophage receptor, outer membrane protein [Candidatus Solibacter sp.]